MVLPCDAHVAHDININADDLAILAKTEEEMAILKRYSFEKKNLKVGKSKVMVIKKGRRKRSYRWW